MFTTFTICGIHLQCVNIYNMWYTFTMRCVQMCVKFTICGMHSICGPHIVHSICIPHIVNVCDIHSICTPHIVNVYNIL